MTLRSLVLVIGMAALLTGCAQTGTSNYFNTGRDAREFNPQTGRYEW